MFKSIAKGVFAEFVANTALKLLLDKKTYTLHKNVTLEINEDTTQIDHVIISKYGIFVIETKNYNGWIFGGEKQKQWTQKIFAKTYKFQNPLHQNYKHIQFLKQVLSVNNVLELKESDFVSIVYFAGNDVELKSELPPNVMRNGVLNFIMSHKVIKLSDIRVRILNERLKEKRLSASFETALKHIENIQKKKFNQN